MALLKLEADTTICSSKWDYIISFFLILLGNFKTTQRTYSVFHIYTGCMPATEDRLSKDLANTFIHGLIK